METRKIQTTGGSSYIVTLPKTWITAHGLKKNDLVEISEQKDGSVIIFPSEDRPVKNDSKVIYVDGIKEGEFLFRLLLGAYVAGYGMIELRGSSLPGEIIDVVERFVQVAIGVEIIEEDSEHMVIKDLADPSEMRMNKSMGRMNSLVTAMLTDVFNAIETSDLNKLKAVISRDREVDRLEWMVSRQTNMFQSDANIAKKMDHTSNKVSLYHTLCRIIERIGDHAVTVAENASSLVDSGDMSDELREAFCDAGNRTVQLFSHCMLQIKQGTLEGANACINDTLKAAEDCAALNGLATGMSGNSAISASLIFGSIRRMDQYSTDIAELAVNDMMLNDSPVRFG